MYSTFRVIYIRCHVPLCCCVGLEGAYSASSGGVRAKKSEVGMLVLCRCLWVAHTEGHLMPLDVLHVVGNTNRIKRYSENRWSVLLTRDIANQ